MAATDPGLGIDLFDRPLRKFGAEFGRGEDGLRQVIFDRDKAGVSGHSTTYSTLASCSSSLTAWQARTLRGANLTPLLESAKARKLTTATESQRGKSSSFS